MCGTRDFFDGASAIENLWPLPSCVTIPVQVGKVLAEFSGQTDWCAVTVMRHSLATILQVCAWKNACCCCGCTALCRLYLAVLTVHGSHGRGRDMP